MSPRHTTIQNNFPSHPMRSQVLKVGEILSVIVIEFCQSCWTHGHWAASSIIRASYTVCIRCPFVIMHGVSLFPVHLAVARLSCPGRFARMVWWPAALVLGNYPIVQNTFLKKCCTVTPCYPEAPEPDKHRMIRTRGY